MRRLSILVLIVALAACSSQTTRVRVVMTLGEHQLVFRAEVAANVNARERGLMSRRGVPAGTGMLFLFPAITRGPFWMKDTLVPLDIGWIRSGRLVEIAHMQPCRADPCPFWTPRHEYDSAFETGVGGLTGLDAGARVEVFGAVPKAS